jgi:hypothetical protein
MFISALPDFSIRLAIGRCAACFSLPPALPDDQDAVWFQSKLVVSRFKAYSIKFEFFFFVGDHFLARVPDGDDALNAQIF